MFSLYFSARPHEFCECMHRGRTDGDDPARVSSHFMCAFDTRNNQRYQRAADIGLSGNGGIAATWSSSEDLCRDTIERFLALGGAQLFLASHFKKVQQFYCLNSRVFSIPCQRRTFFQKRKTRFYFWEKTFFFFRIELFRRTIVCAISVAWDDDLLTGNMSDGVPAKLSIQQGGWVIFEFFLVIF